MIQVRAARPDELDAAGELTLAVYREEDGFIGGDYAASLRDAARRAREAALLVAVDEDGRLLGTITWCAPGSPWQELAREGDGEVRMLAVAPAARRRGVGALLTRACIDRACADGLTGIVLSTPQAATAAHALYESLGFVRDPDRDWVPAPEVPLLAYRLEL